MGSGLLTKLVPKPLNARSSVTLGFCGEKDGDKDRKKENLRVPQEPCLLQACIGAHAPSTAVGCHNLRYPHCSPSHDP